MGISGFPRFDPLRRVADPSQRRASAHEVKVRGSAVAPVRPFVQRTFGDAGWDRFLARLEPDARAAIVLPTIATNWYPYLHCCAYIDGIYELADRRPSALRDFAIHNLDYATSFVFRAIFKVGSPEFMVARSDQVWRKFYSEGRMVCDVRPSHARIELHDFPLGSATYARVITHSIEAVLLKAGAKITRAGQSKSTLEGDPFSEFTYDWT